MVRQSWKERLLQTKSAETEVGEQQPEGCQDIDLKAPVIEKMRAALEHNPGPISAFRPTAASMILRSNCAEQSAGREDVERPQATICKAQGIEKRGTLPEHCAQGRVINCLSKTLFAKHKAPAGIASKAPLQCREDEKDVDACRSVPEVFTPPQETRTLDVTPENLTEAPDHDTDVSAKRKASSGTADPEQCVRLHHDAEFCKSDTLSAKYKVSSGVASNLLQHLGSHKMPHVKALPSASASPVQHFRPHESAIVSNGEAPLSARDTEDFNCEKICADNISLSRIASKARQHVRSKSVSHVKKAEASQETPGAKYKVLSGVASNLLQHLKSQEIGYVSTVEALPSTVSVSTQHPRRNEVVTARRGEEQLPEHKADLCNSETLCASHKSLSGVTPNPLQHLKIHKVSPTKTTEIPLPDQDNTSSSLKHFRIHKVTPANSAEVQMSSAECSVLYPNSCNSEASCGKYKVSSNVASSLLQHLRSSDGPQRDTSEASLPESCRHKDADAHICNSDASLAKQNALPDSASNGLDYLRSHEVATSSTAEVSGADGQQVAAPSFGEGALNDEKVEAEAESSHALNQLFAMNTIETKAADSDEDELSSDGMEFDARWEKEPRDCVAPPEDGPWTAGGLEFFSSFDSGNCAGVTLTPASPSQVNESSSLDSRSPDVLWASAREQEHEKLLYEVVQARCPVHANPDHTSKIVTRKSRGAQFYAANRKTLTGWQALIGEKGWVCVFDHSLPIGQREMARVASHCSSIVVRQFGEPIRFCKLEVDAKNAHCFQQVLRIFVEGMYILLRPDAFPSLRGIVLPSQASNTEATKEVVEDKDSDSHHTLSVDVSVRADCQGTAFARDDCQWFYFGVRGQPDGFSKLRLRILGLSRFKKFEEKGIVRGPLLTDGVQPVFRYCQAGAAVSSTETEWKLVTGDYGVEKMSDGSFACHFEHILGDELSQGKELYFALTFPYPLARIREHVNMIHHQFLSAGTYVCREHLLDSLGGHPIELLTISKNSDCRRKRQSPLEGLIVGRRPRMFRERQAIFISCRVHPGETPASYMLEGLLDFLVSDDPAALELLQRYVFHIVPVLNPDGVVLGHHRTDLMGENLNRVYGNSKLQVHPSIYAAEVACASAHKHQGGLRLYLDLHAHSNRRGAFLLGDADVKGGIAQAQARLFGYALCRRCSVFEFSQSDFNHAVAGTGKSGISQLTGVPLCFTVESHYFRGHHSTVPFGPATWRGIGRSCLEALLDCDKLERPTDLGLSLQDERHKDDFQQAMKSFTAEAFKAKSSASFKFTGPSRARPEFGHVLGPVNDHEPSPEIWARPELMGKTAEIIEQEWRSAASAPAELWCRLHEVDGGIWVPSRDLQRCDSQKGTFFYGVLTQATVTADPTRGRRIITRLPPGTTIEVSERRMVDGWLRLRVVADTNRGKCAGWVSEYKDVFFDPRLGGTVQLMRLKGPPVSMNKKQKGVYYAYAS